MRQLFFSLDEAAAQASDSFPQMTTTEFLGPIMLLGVGALLSLLAFVTQKEVDHLRGEHTVDPNSDTMDSEADNETDKALANDIAALVLKQLQDRRQDGIASGRCNQTISNPAIESESYE